MMGTSRVVSAFEMMQICDEQLQDYLDSIVIDLALNMICHLLLTDALNSARGHDGLTRPNHSENWAWCVCVLMLCVRAAHSTFGMDVCGKGNPRATKLLFHSIC